MNTITDTDTDTVVLVELEWWDSRTGAELVEHARHALHTTSICDADAIHVYTQSLLGYSPHGDGECSLWLSVNTSRPVHDVAAAIRAASIRVKSASPIPATLATADDSVMHDWLDAERAARWADYDH